MYAMMKDEAWQVRTPAVAYFGKLGDPKYKDVLEAALQDRHMMVRITTATRFAKWPTINYLARPSYTCGGEIASAEGSGVRNPKSISHVSIRC